MFTKGQYVTGLNRDFRRSIYQVIMPIQCEDESGLTYQGLILTLYRFSDYVHTPSPDLTDLIVRAASNFRLATLDEINGVYMTIPATNLVAGPDAYALNTDDCGQADCSICNPDNR